MEFRLYALTNFADVVVAAMAMHLGSCSKHLGDTGGLTIVYKSRPVAHVTAFRKLFIDAVCEQHHFEV